MVISLLNVSVSKPAQALARRREKRRRQPGRRKEDGAAIPSASPRES